jgi:hypothetical protein
LANLRWFWHVFGPIAGTDICYGFTKFKKASDRACGQF